MKYRKSCFCFKSPIKNVLTSCKVIVIKINVINKCSNNGKAFIIVRRFNDLLALLEMGIFSYHNSGEYYQGVGGSHLSNGG